MTNADRLLPKQIQFKKCQTHSTELDTLGAAKIISEHLSISKRNRLRFNYAHIKHFVSKSRHLIISVSVRVIL
jgi:hypothetical protein